MLPKSINSCFPIRESFFVLSDMYCEHICNSSNTLLLLSNIGESKEIACTTKPKNIIYGYFYLIHITFSLFQNIGLVGYDISEPAQQD